VESEAEEIGLAQSSAGVKTARPGRSAEVGFVLIRGFLRIKNLATLWASHVLRVNPQYFPGLGNPEVDDP
jgi:hypothetical protein